MGGPPLPGLQARYLITPAAHTARLRLSLQFAPTGETEAARAACAALIAHLTATPERAAPAVELRTPLAPAPLAATVDGSGLAAELNAFLAEIGARLDGADKSSSVLVLDFDLDPSEVAKLDTDLFDLA